MVNSMHLELKERARESRLNEGYCPFQRKTPEGVRYCSVFNPSLTDPHRFCEYLSRVELAVTQTDKGNPIEGTYFRSDFIPRNED